jgi:hypothetical protein
MVMLTPGKVFRSREPRIAVENKLAVGKHSIRLTVVDNSRNESVPFDLTIVVRERLLPGRIFADLTRIIRDVVEPVIHRPVVPGPGPIRRRPPNG